MVRNDIVSKVNAARMHTHTTLLSYRGISLSYRVISLSYALFHFPCVILIEQQFSPCIFKGYLCAVLLLLLYTYRSFPLQHKDKVPAEGAAQ